VRAVSLIHQVVGLKQPLRIYGGRLAFYPFLKPHSCGSLLHWVCPFAILHIASSLLLGNFPFRFEAVIHFAGLKAVGESVQKPLLYYDNNVIGTINLLEVMSVHGCKKVSIFFPLYFTGLSTSSCYCIFSEFVCSCMLGCYIDLTIGLLIGYFLTNVLVLVHPVHRRITT
jgi:hypothetical protein